MGMEVGNFVGFRLTPLADYASKSLHAFLDLNFKVIGSRQPTDEQVIAVINKSFDEVVCIFI
jgi:hypothetical protein